jgi:DNA-binding SARP family transcriptional activator/tetratricopeptide (TPR) repeat protein
MRVVEGRAVGVEFTLLGEVGVTVGGVAVEPGPSRQRAVLAALAVDVNQAVPADQLADRVWGELVPPSVRTTLRVYLSRLRAAGLEIVRRSGGYVLVAEVDSVDLHRYRELVGRARSERDDVRALASFDEAARLWTGTPLLGVESPWLDATRYRLERERFLAEADHHDVALRLGGHARFVDVLAERAEAHPLDERLAGQFMLALHQSGRSADALEHHARVRRLLADQLGVDPGPGLRAVHQQVLEAAPAGPAPAAPMPSVPVPAGPVPRQLPSDLPGFSGREDLLASLDALLSHGTTVVISALAGTAGIGKTTLAVHWAHRVAHRFPDGQLYVNLRGFDAEGSVVRPADAVRGFLDALGVPPHRVPAGFDAQVGLYRTMLAERRMIVVLDNARDAAQVRPLIAGSAGCAVLVTSRNELAGLVASTNARLLSLDLLTDGEARGLLEARLGAERVQADPAAIAEIITRCARLPLALAVVAARAAARPRTPLSAFAAELRRDRLAGLASDDAHTDVRSVFSWSYRALSPAAARLFGLLGLHPGADFTAQAAASLAGSPDVWQELGELTRAHLLTEHRPGRFRFHDLLRAYAAEQTCGTERQDALERLVDHYRHTAQVLDRVFFAGGTEVEPEPPAPGTVTMDLAGERDALAWFQAEQVTLFEIVRLAGKTGLHRQTWRLATAIADLCDRHAQVAESLAAQRIGLAAAQHLGERRGEAGIRQQMARLHTRLGKFADAESELTEALEINRDIGDIRNEARTELGLARLAGTRGDDREALQHARQAYELFSRAGSGPGQQDALNGIAWCLAQLGEHEEALSYCDRALVIGTSSGVVDTKGYIYQQLGDHAAAVVCFERAIVMARRAGDRFAEAEALTHLGDSHQTSGDGCAARSAWEAALTLLEGADVPEADGLRGRLDSL